MTPWRLAPARRRGLTLLRGEEARSSRVDPVTEGERIASGVTADGGVLVFGASPLYHLLAVGDGPGPFECIETDADLARSAKDLLLDACLRDGRPERFARRWIFLGPEAVPSLLSSLRRNPTKRTFLAPPGADGEVLVSVRDALAAGAREAITESHFHDRWIANAWIRLAAKSPLRWLDGRRIRSDGDVAILVGSAPSLENHLDRLRTLSSTRPLLALPGALPQLRRGGVKVAVVLSSDGGFWNGAHFLDFRSEPEEVLLLSLSVHPALSRKFPDALTFVDDDAFLREEAERLPPDLRRRLSDNLMPMQGSSACHLPTLAARLGFRRIALAGLDFASDAWRTHANGNAVEERLFSEGTRTSPALHLASRIYPPAPKGDPRLRLYGEAFEGAERRAGLTRIPLEAVAPSSIPWSWERESIPPSLPWRDETVRVTSSQAKDSGAGNPDPSAYRRARLERRRPPTS